jgi:hypothetical protein
MSIIATSPALSPTAAHPALSPMLGDGMLAVGDDQAACDPNIGVYDLALEPALGSSRGGGDRRLGLMIDHFRSLARWAARHTSSAR